MPNASRVQFTITDLSFSIAAILKGVSFVEGITKRGPHAKADILINNWPQFERLYGGYIPNSDFPLLCKRAFDRGAILRVNRVGHYTDITDAATLDATRPALLSAFKITFSAALVTANVINISINGVAIAPITFATDSDTTMGVIATALTGLSNVVSATVVPVAAAVDNDRVILVHLTSGVALTFVGAVTLGASQATMATSVFSNIINTAGDLILAPSTKYLGVDYNNVYIIIANASNGQAAYFDMAIVFTGENQLLETYNNLTIPGSPTVVQSTYLDDVNKASQLLQFAYLNLSALTAPIRPANGSYYFGGASDGTTPINTDYIGDVTGKNGFYAFDAVDDALQMAAPEISDMAIHTAGSAYAENRKDLMYFAHLSNALLTATDLVTERASTSISSYYTEFWAGGLKITDPVSGLEKEISEIGDILGITAYSDNKFGPWYSFAGLNRGIILNALGVVNNFGTNALYNDRNQLANRQINVVAQKNNQIYLMGNFSGVLTNSKLSWTNVVRFVIWLQKSLRPTLERYLEEPNDIPTFKAIFNEVQPFLERLVVDRALFDYQWRGDQDVTDITKVVINTPTDLDNGKYKVQLWLKVIPTMNEITVDIVIAPTGLDFSIQPS